MRATLSLFNLRNFFTKTLFFSSLYWKKCNILYYPLYFFSSNPCSSQFIFFLNRLDKLPRVLYTPPNIGINAVPLKTLTIITGYPIEHYVGWNDTSSYFISYIGGVIPFLENHFLYENICSSDLQTKKYREIIEKIKSYKNIVKRQAWTSLS